MEKDQGIGWLIFLISIVAILIYGWLVFFVNPNLVLQLTAFIGVTVLLAIVGWIGWTMARTPPPPPIEPEPAAQPAAQPTG